MAEPILYSRDHAQRSVVLRLADDLLELTTTGKGLIDRPRILTVPVADLKNFALVPTVNIQHVTGGRLSNPQTDLSYDSEFFLSYTVDGKVKKKRVFILAQDPNFRAILDALKARRPEASLLDLGPAEVHERMGFITARQAVWIIVGLLVGLPVLVVILILLSKFWHGSPKS
jgi:hypothetical protein